METGKTAKYFKYAIGEIVLVVIGILIALSINNWNDTRKDRVAEKKLFRTLVRSLESDLKDVREKHVIIDSAIIGQEIFITESYDEVTTRFNDQEINNLIWKVANTSKSFVPNISLYNKISQNKQIDLVQSEELQLKIIDLYEVQYWEYKDLDATLENQAQLGLISNYFGNTAHLYIKKVKEIDVELERKYIAELSKECRKIYFLSLATKRSMLNCENKIESLLEILKEILKT